MSETSTSMNVTTGTGADEADVSHQAGAEPAVVLDAASDAVGAELVRLLADSSSGHLASEAASGASDAAAYDGHVALALDLDFLPAIDSTLDLLTSSHQLFDVPALDVASTYVDDPPDSRQPRTNHDYSPV